MRVETTGPTGGPTTSPTTSATTPAPDKGGRFFTGFLMLACAVLAALVVMLALQNRDLKAELAQSAAPFDPSTAIKPGDSIAPLIVRDASAGDGSAGEGAEAAGDASITFGADEGATLLMVFSRQCPACTQVKPAWNRLAAAAQGAGLRALGIAVGEESASHADHAAPGTPGSPGSPTTEAAPPSYPVRDLKSFIDSDLIKIRMVPTTLLIEPGGKVARVWYGALSEQMEQEALQAIAVHSDKSGAAHGRAPANQLHESVQIRERRRLAPAKSTGGGTEALIAHSAMPRGDSCLATQSSDGSVVLAVSPGPGPCVSLTPVG